MEIRPLDRLVASTLPRQITHTVFAHSFLVARWADEGGAMLAEDREDQKLHENRLRDIWKRGSFIPLRRLFVLPDFPTEKQLPAFSAEAYAVTRFLVEKQDRQGVLKFVALGIHQGWDKAAQSQYGYDDVEELERAWLAHEGLREGDNPGYQVARKLQLAFGKDCQEVNGAAIRLEFRSRHMVVAASRLTLEADGRVMLSPCYIAAFDQEPDGRRPAQITAIRTSMACITFDQPIRNIADMAKREISFVDLPGNVRIVGNK